MLEHGINMEQTTDRFQYRYVFSQSFNPLQKKHIPDMFMCGKLSEEKVAYAFLSILDIKWVITAILTDTIIIAGTECSCDG